MENIKVVAFDADDTLWANESYFHQIEKEYCELLSSYFPLNHISEELFKTEMQNIHLYGYGIKSFTLSMIETALRITDNQIDMKAIETIIQWGKQLLDMPVEVLPGVEEVLKSLKGNYRLIVATKGDLLDQEKKLYKSGLQSYFHHVEIMSDKKIDDYRKLMEKLSCNPREFLMVGNSIKSDIIPVLELKGKAIHIPFHVTWAHEEVVDQSINKIDFITLKHITDLLNHLKS